MLLSLPAMLWFHLPRTHQLSSCSHQDGGSISTMFPGVLPRLMLDISMTMSPSKETPKPLFKPCQWSKPLALSLGQVSACVLCCCRMAETKHFIMSSRMLAHSPGAGKSKIKGPAFGESLLAVITWWEVEVPEREAQLTFYNSPFPPQYH